MLSLGSITLQCNELLTSEPSECKVVYCYYYVFINPIYSLMLSSSMHKKYTTNYHILYYLQMTV